MRFIAPTARILLGLVFVVFSANYFHPFLPAPGPMPAEAMTFAGALFASHLITFIKVIEMAAGIALLANRAVPLAMTLLAPIIVGIAFFHIVLAPAGLGIALFILALELVLAWSYRSAFKPMLGLNVKPDPVAHSVRVTDAVAAH